MYICVCMYIEMHVYMQINKPVCMQTSIYACMCMNHPVYDAV